MRLSYTDATLTQKTFIVFSASFKASYEYKEWITLGFFISQIRPRSFFFLGFCCTNLNFCSRTKQQFLYNLADSDF